MKVLITGVSGFVGRRLARRLIDAGDDVAGLVLSREDPDTASVDPRVLVVCADLLDTRALARAVEAAEPEAIVHLGGLSAVGASWDRVADYYRVNVLGTRHLLAAAPSGARLLLASSAEVYGAVEPTELPLVEDQPLRPPSPYALTKACSELLVLREGGMVVRSFNLLGAGQARGFVLPDFATQLAAIARGESPPVLRVGNLEARRDFLHVEDGASGYQTLMRRGEQGEVYNLASGRALSIRELLVRLIAISGVEVVVRQDPERMRPVDVPVLEGSAARLAALGWRAERSVDEALAELWDEVRGRPS